jgi:hypothetical protein
LGEDVIEEGLDTSEQIRDIGDIMKVDKLAWNGTGIW